MADKTSILVWADSPVAATGFSQVTRQVLKRLNDTGKYEIVIAGINHSFSYYSQKDFPYEIHGSQKDLYSSELMQNLLMQPRFKIFFTINDVGIQQSVSQLVAQRKEKDPNFKWIAYFPMDVNYSYEGSFNWLTICDYPVVYTEFARKVIDKFVPVGTRKIRIIGHGSDLDEIYPKERDFKFRREVLKVKDDETLVVNINRNQWRKNFPATFIAFREFKKTHPKSRLYIHAKKRDMGGDLVEQAVNAGLSVRDDIIVTADSFNTGLGIPRELLNEIYNCADLYLTTTYGEGWGLTITEAMQAKVPVVAPRNSSIIEILGKNEDRGYLVDMQTGLNKYHYLFRDTNIGRVAVDIYSVVKKLSQAIDDKEETQKKVAAAYEWVSNNTWDKIANKWIKLFEKAAQ